MSSLAGVLGQLLCVVYKDGSDKKWIQAIRCFHIVLTRTIDSTEPIRFVQTFRRLMQPQRFDGFVLMEMIDLIQAGLDDFVPGNSECLLLAACLDSRVSDRCPSDKDILRWFRNASTNQARLVCLDVLAQKIPSFNLLRDLFSEQPEILFRFASKTRQWQKDRDTEIVHKMILKRGNKNKSTQVMLRNAIVALSGRLDKLTIQEKENQIIPLHRTKSMIDRVEDIILSRKSDIARYELSCLIQNIILKCTHDVDKENNNNNNSILYIIQQLCTSYSEIVQKCKKDSSRSVTTLPYSMMMRELLLYAVAWEDSPRRTKTKSCCCCVCDQLLSEQICIRRDAFLVITKHARVFLLEIAKGKHFSLRTDDMNDLDAAHASHARILAIAMLSSSERLPLLMKWDEEEEKGTFMGGLHQAQLDGGDQDEDLEEIHHYDHDKLLEVPLRTGDLVERLAVEDVSRHVKEFCSRVSILQFRKSSPDIYDRYLVDFLHQVQTHRNTKLLRKPSFQIRSLRRYVGREESVLSGTGYDDNDDDDDDSKCMSYSRVVGKNH